MFRKNPLILVFLVLAAITSMKMVYQGETKIDQMERIQRICSTLPQPHPDCSYSSQAADPHRSLDHD